jgi:hypothetical protein
MTPPVPFGISVRPSLSIFQRKSKWYVKDRLQIFTNGELTHHEKQVFGPFETSTIAESFLLHILCPRCDQPTQIRQHTNQKSFTGRTMSALVCLR